MGYYKLVVHSVLLFTSPSIALHPHSNSLPAILQVQKVSLEERQIASHCTPSYDEIIQLLNAIESGELEKKCTPEELERIKYFVAFLAKEGALPDDSEESLSMDNDIEELLNEDDTTFSFEAYDNYQYMIVPAVWNEQSEIVLCKSWAKKQWKHIKKFAKKHRKALIIGAAVVVAATVVIVAVAASSVAAGAAAASAAGAAGAGASEADCGEKNTSKVKDEQASVSPSNVPSASISALAATNDAPILKTVLQEHITTFKELVAEEHLTNPSGHSKDLENAIFGENVRKLGAILAHETLDGVSELTACVPQLLQEIKDLGHRIAPENFLSPNEELAASPLENYEALITAGHKKIDQLFSTNQAQRYSPQAQEENDKFSIGVLPLPGMFHDVKKLTEAGRALDKAGFTRAGRGLMKHGYREHSIFPKPVGTPAQVNEHGQKVLESIVNHPERKIIPGEFERYGKVIDIYAPNIGGARYNVDGKFLGFLEP
jgi:hypothetical protein